MRALSLKQPWATLCANAIKLAETRSWRARDGELVICSSRHPAIEPAGCALAIARIECAPFIEEMEPLAMCPWSPGRWAFILYGIQRVEPFPVVGRQRWFDVPRKKLRLRDEPFPMPSPKELLARGVILREYKPLPEGRARSG